MEYIENYLLATQNVMVEMVIPVNLNSNAKFNGQVEKSKYREERMSAIVAEKNFQNITEMCLQLAKTCLEDLNEVHALKPTELSVSQNQYLTLLKSHIYMVTYASSMAKSRHSLDSALASNIDQLLVNVLGSLNPDEVVNRFVETTSKMDSGTSKAAIDANRYKTRIEIPENIQNNESLQQLHDMMESAELTRTSLRAILAGPPGIGKSLAAHYAAKYWSNSDNLFVITSSSALDLYVGVAEKATQQIFDYFDSNPTVRGVIFMDEGNEYLAKDISQYHKGVKNVIQIAMGNVYKYNNVCMLLATNYPDQIDGVIRSRFGKTINYKLPTAADLLNIMLNAFKLSEPLLPPKDTPAYNLLVYIRDNKNDGWITWENRLNSYINASYRDVVGFINAFKQDVVKIVRSNDYLGVILNVFDPTECLLFELPPRYSEVDTFLTINPGNVIDRLELNSVYLVEHDKDMEVFKNIINWPLNRYSFLPIYRKDVNTLPEFQVAYKK